MSIKEFACEACHKLGQESFILDCGHVKCESCLLSSSYELHGDHSWCGECNKRNVRMGTKFYERNFLHSKVNLLSDLMQTFSNENPVVECFLCIEKGGHKPEYFCFDSNRFYCKPHFELHNEKDDCVFLSKAEILDQNFSLLQARRDCHEPMCSEHPNRFAAVYLCTEDNKFVCTKCESEHRNHELISVNKAMEKTKSVLEIERRLVEESRNELKDRSQNLQEKSDFERQQYEDREMGVQESYNARIRKLERERDEQLAKMSSVFKEKANALEEAKQKNEIQLQTMYRFENISKLCTQILASSEQIEHKDTIQQLLRKVHNKTEPKKKIDQDELVEKPFVRTPPVKSPAVKRKDYVSSVNTEIFSCPNEAKTLSDVTFDKQNNIYVADCTNKLILAFTSSGKLFKQYILFPYKAISQCSTIPSLCYFSERIIFTTISPNKAYELNLQNGNANELVEKFLFIAGRPFIKPLGMATSIDGKLLYICDQSDNQVHIISEKLKKEDSIPNIPEPVGIASAPNSDIYILSKGSQSKIFVLRDKYVKQTIDLLGAHIEYIATNHMNQILISDTNRHCIAVYNQEGVKTKTFGGCAQSERINYPVGLAVDGLGRVVVAEMVSKQIKVFSNLTF